MGSIWPAFLRKTGTSTPPPAAFPRLPSGNAGSSDISQEIPAFPYYYPTIFTPPFTSSEKILRGIDEIPNVWTLSAEGTVAILKGEIDLFSGRYPEMGPVFIDHFLIALDKGMISGLLQTLLIKVLSAREGPGFQSQLQW